MTLSLVLFAAQALQPAATEPQAPPAAPQATTPFAGAARLDADAMQRTTAREDLGQIAAANQAASVSNNQINGDSRTGAVSLDGNAFQNMSGLSVLSANSGNNVAINSAINVNVSITPRP